MMERVALGSQPSGARFSARWIALLPLGFAAASYLYAVEPGAGTTPGCPWLWLTGWMCAGCGSLRAVHALLHGELPTAWALNPLLVASIPALVAGLALQWVPAWHRFRQRRHDVVRWFYVLLAAVFVGYGIARNLSC